MVWAVCINIVLFFVSFRATNAFVDLKVKNLPLQFYSSTVAGLADLFEDEIIPSAIPMQVKNEANYFITKNDLLIWLIQYSRLNWKISHCVSLKIGHLLILLHLEVCRLTLRYPRWLLFEKNPDCFPFNRQVEYFVKKIIARGRF